ncbi:HEAT repeat domain-containing protein [Myxococcota bacterium]|nr:HEAT repeat domain-containing protein [Myxococcota bacterium]
MVKSATRGNIASRVGAIEKLASSKSKKALKAIIGNLNHRNSLVRRTAARALRGHGIEAAWPLIHRLKDGDVRVRQVIVGTLFTLPPAPFVLHALAGILEDPSRHVRNALVTGFKKAGLPLRDILVINGHLKRHKALAGLSSRRPEERAAAVRTLGELGQSMDLAFILPNVVSKDPFIYGSALTALAHQRDPELLPIYLLLPGTEQRNISILRWLTLQNSISDAQWRQLVSTSMDQDFLLSLLPPTAPSLKCSLLAHITKEASILRFKGTSCPLPPSLSLSGKVALNLILHGELPKEITAILPGKLGELSQSTLALLLRKNLQRKEILAMVTAKWDQFLFSYTKWIPGSTWEKLALVGPTDLKPDKTAKLTPREKLLSVYRSKVNVHTAHELLPPQFDLPLFTSQLRAMKGEKTVYPLLLRIISTAPSALQRAAISCIRGLKGPLPREILTAAESDDPLVRKEAITLMALADDIDPVLRWFTDPDPNVREIVIGAIERTGSPAGLKLVMSLFSKEPTARLAEVLGKLKVKKALPELLSLMKEDTARAMDKDRAAVLASLYSIAPSNLDVQVVVGDERFHPSHVVQCTALSLTGDKALREIYGRYSPYLSVRRCAAKSGKPSK